MIATVNVDNEIKSEPCNVGQEEKLGAKACGFKSQVLIG